MVQPDLTSIELRHDVGDAMVHERILLLDGRVLWTIFYFSVLLLARVLFGIFTGAFSLPPYSDALIHFQIAQAWYEMADTFQVTPDLLSRAYAEGTWPPLWHAAMAGFMFLFGNDSVVAVTFALLVNTSACALFAFFFGRTIISFIVSAALSLSPLVTFLAFQTRPENLVFLLMVAFSFLCLRLGKKRALDQKPSYLEVIFAGMVMGGLCLTHASTIFIVGAALVLLAFGARKTRTYLVTIAITLALITPWQLALLGSSSNLPIGSTSSSLNLMIGNNPFLRDDLSNWMEAQQKAVVLAKERASADPIRFKRPFLIPQSYYEKWLTLQNEQYQMRLIAVQHIKADPAGFLKRAVFRFWLFLVPNNGPTDNSAPASRGLAALAVVGQADSWIALLLTIGAVGIAYRRRASGYYAYSLIFLAAAWIPIIFILPLHRLMLPVDIFALSIILSAMRVEAPSTKSIRICSQVDGVVV